MVTRRDSGDAPIRRNEPIELQQRYVVGAGGEHRLLGRFRGHRHPLVPVGGALTPLGPPVLLPMRREVLLAMGAQKVGPATYG